MQCHLNHGGWCHLLECNWLIFIVHFGPFEAHFLPQILSNDQIIFNPLRVSVPNGERNSSQTYGVGNRIDEDTSVKILRHIGALILDILQKQYREIMQKKLKKTRAWDIFQFWSQFWENEYASQLVLRRRIFLSNMIWNIPSFEY